MDAKADGPGPEPARDGPHPAAARAPRLRRGDRQPALVSRDDREPLRRWLRLRHLELAYSHEEALLGTAGGVRNVASFLGDSFLVVAGDALTDIDLRAMREFHDSHDGLATLATKRVADTDQFGVVITGADGRIQGFQEKPDPAEALSDLANYCIYMFRSEIFDFFPAPGTSKAAGPEDQPEFADWAMDVFPALLTATSPFYSHEIDAYWNDIGNLDELRQGNLDALNGPVEVEVGGPEVADGVRAASPLESAEVTAAARRRGGRDRRRGPHRGPGDRRRRLPARRRGPHPRRDPPRRRRPGPGTF